MSIFEQASRQKLRFPSLKGELTVEQLWDLPLQSKSGFDLDTIAKSVSRDLKAVTEASVVIETSPANTTLVLKLDLMKHIIAVRLAENAAAVNRAARAAERQKLLGVLADKQDESLKALTPAEIQQRLAELDK